MPSKIVPAYPAYLDSKVQQNLEIHLEAEEGVELSPYKDTGGNTTLGIGRNVSVRKEWISKVTAKQMLKEDISDAVFSLQKVLPSFKEYSASRQVGLLSMMFQMGYTRFKGFKDMIKNILQNNWPGAIMEAKDSDWYREFPSRGARVIKLLQQG